MGIPTQKALGLVASPDANAPGLIHFVWATNLHTRIHPHAHTKQGRGETGDSASQNLADRKEIARKNRPKGLLTGSEAEGRRSLI